MHDYPRNPAAIDALRPEQYYVTQEGGTRATLHRRVFGQPRAGHLRRRGVG